MIEDFLKNNSVKKLKSAIKKDQELLQDLKERTRYLDDYEFKYKNEFETRYAFFIGKATSENWCCPYCGVPRGINNFGKLISTCGDDECVKKLQHDAKKKLHANMSDTKKKELRDKMKKTCLERYGVEYSTQSDIMKENSCKTKLERYGDEKYVNKHKRLKTVNEKYGGNAPLCSNDVKDKLKRTNIEKYGVVNVFQSEEIKEKIKATNLEKYGVEYPMMSKEIQSKVDYITAIDKQIESKRKNHTFNTSRPEKELQKILEENFNNVIHEYRDERYAHPYTKSRFKCDFYLGDYDIFIEYQGIYHHGKEPFDKNNEKHLEILRKWQEKCINNEETSYNMAIYVWTVLDPIKREVAKQNGLKYIEIFPEDGKLPKPNKIIELISSYIKNINQ